MANYVFVETAQGLYGSFDVEVSKYELFDLTLVEAFKHIFGDRGYFSECFEDEIQDRLELSCASEGDMEYISLNYDEADCVLVLIKL